MQPSTDAGRPTRRARTRWPAMRRLDRSLEPRSPARAVLDPPADVGDRRAPVDDDAAGRPVALAEHAEQDVLGRDRARAETEGLAQRQLEARLGRDGRTAGGRRMSPRRAAGAATAPAVGSRRGARRRPRRARRRGRCRSRRGPAGRRPDRAAAWPSTAAATPAAVRPASRSAVAGGAVPVEQGQQEVLGADRPVAEAAGVGLGADDDGAGVGAEPFEHRLSSSPDACGGRSAS